MRSGAVRFFWVGCAALGLAACGNEPEGDASGVPARNEIGNTQGDGGGTDAGSQVGGDASHHAAPDTGARSDAAADTAVLGDAAADSSWCATKAVLDAHCTSCHRAGGVGPMPLTGYDDLLRPSTVDANASVYERMSARIHAPKSPMPPTGLLAPRDLAVLDAFIAARAPAPGEEDCANPMPVPEPTPWPTNCDATYQLLSHAPGQVDVPFVVPAGGEIHPQVPLDAPWGDEEVQAIAFRPITDNAAVLHHWILQDTSQTFLSGWAPGGTGSPPLPTDVGMYMPRGAGSLVLDMHYFNVVGGSTQSDRSGVEVCVLKKPNFRAHTASVFREFGSIGGSDLVLAPAGSLRHTETGSCTVKTTEPVHLLSISPHAHTYAVHMKFTVKKANGREITLYDQPFSFDAQGNHALPEPLVLETGDKVITACTYDNETGKNVRFGESTKDEMCFNFAGFYPMGALSCGARQL